uniref:Peptidase M16 middle/third domain-containing protein n=1 Tax=Parascaris equorum TaxID=6256 RepID=A0A914RSV7_PAREQ
MEIIRYDICCGSLVVDSEGGCTLIGFDDCRQNFSASYWSRRNWVIACGTQKTSLEGFAHVDDIIILLFNYIGMLKRSGSLRRWWDEMAQIYKLLFTYKDKEQPIYYAPYLSQRMLEYPMEDVLYAHRRCDLYDEGLIAKDSRVSSINRTIHSIIGEEISCHPCFDREKWYETEYKRYHFTKEFIASCERAMTERNEDLALPPPNEYIPTDFTLKIPEPSSPVSYRTAADFAYMDLMVECFKVLAIASLHFIL